MRIARALVVGALAAGCGADPVPEGPPSAGERVTDTPPIVARFDCDTFALTATFHEGRVTLDLPGRSVTLARVESASGARFSDKGMSFWNKGWQATFDVDGRTEMCRERRDPWQDARDRGVDFRAVGQEPGWFLEIDREKHLRLVYDYAEREVETPARAPERTGSTVSYATTAGTHQLRIIIDEKPCTHTMSGEAFPASVTVGIDDRTLHGCGRDLAGGARP